MDKNNIIIIILIINLLFTFYLYFKINKTNENFTASSPDQLKQTIKDIYQADIASIRSLADIATKLQAGGTTVPGNLKISQILGVNYIDTAFNDTTTGRSQFAGRIQYGGLDANALGIVGKGLGETDRLVHIWDHCKVENSLTVPTINATNITATNITSTNLNLTNIVAPVFKMNRGIVKAQPECYMDFVSSPESATIVGKAVDKTTDNLGSRRIDLWDNVIVYGSLTTSTGNIQAQGNINCVTDGFNSSIFYKTGNGNIAISSSPLTPGLYISTYCLNNDTNTTGSVWTYIVSSTANGGSLNTALWNGRLGTIQWNIVNTNIVTATYGFEGSASLRIVKICNF
jgi:hypothetical protein